MRVFAAALAITVAVLAQDSKNDDVEFTKDIEYGKGGEVSLKLDIYRPKGASEELLPAVVFIHGGGWRAGDKAEGKAGFSRNLAKRGYVVASINYRLSDVAPFPAAVEDCKCAVRWLRANAKKCGVNADKIGAWGTSAGGHLSLMVGCADEKAGLEGKGGNEEVSSRVKCACSWFGPADFTKGNKEFESGRGPSVVKFLGGTPEEKPDAYRQASPITHVSQDDPPVLMIHGDQDDIVPISQSETMLAKLQEAKVEASLVRVKNAGHGFKGTKAGKPDMSIDQILKTTFEFFDKHLKAK